MDFWTQVAGASQSKGGPYVGTGRHILRIKTVAHKPVKKGSNDLKFVAELEVIWSDNPTHKPGETRSWMPSAKYDDQYQGEIQGFILACAGVDNSNEAAVQQAKTAVVQGPAGPEPWAAQVGRHATANNGFAGTIMYVEGWTKDGAKYVKTRWSKHPDQTLQVPQNAQAQQAPQAPPPSPAVQAPAPQYAPQAAPVPQTPPAAPQYAPQPQPQAYAPQGYAPPQPQAYAPPQAPPEAYPPQQYAQPQGVPGGYSPPQYTQAGYAPPQAPPQGYGAPASPPPPPAPGYPMPPGGYQR